MMGVNKIALKTRLERIGKGFAADPAYITHVVRSMAERQLSECLGDKERTWMKEWFSEHGVWKDNMTYQEAAWHIERLSGQKETKLQADAAVIFLSMPLYAYWMDYERRKADAGRK